MLQQRESTSAFSVPDRREVLRRCSVGFGATALAHLLQRDAAAMGTAPDNDAGVPEPRRTARSVIFCYMSGGVSHVDSFDPKPKLNELHGKPMPVPVERTQFNQNGTIMGSPFSFQNCGESGLSISSMFPRLGEVADELAVVRSMTTSVNEHAQANFMAHSGFPFMGHPAAGAWCSYGLGCANQNLPAYVVLRSGDAVAPHGGVGLFSSAFLPAENQGSVLYADRPQALANIQPVGSPAAQQRRLQLSAGLDQGFLNTVADDAAVAGAVRNYETAFRMQTAVPELCDISGESRHTMSAYGTDSEDTRLAAYARQCLLARRLVERGVRFVELSCLTYNIGAGNGANPWDQHGDLERGHAAMARQVDQPIAALISDLRQRGLLDETLIVWAGEFGRTPFSQGSNGRDHNPLGYSVWLAGGGVKGGVSYGATDDLGYRAVESPCTIYDVWATVLHQLGLNHRKLTYRYGGRDFRLTDVHGNVLSDLL